MTTTQQLRDWWAPPCVGPFAKVALHGEGIVSVAPEIVDAVHALNACLAAHDYPTRKADTGAYNCRPITGDPSKYSLHAYGIALDINWQSNPYGSVLVTDMPLVMVDAIKRIRTRNGKQVWRWGGNYSGNKDAMHFEVTCHPADLETGLDPSTIPSEEDDMGEALDKLNAIELRVIALAKTVQELSDDVPDNLPDQLAEIRRNLRRTAEAAGVPVGDIET